MDLSKFYRVNGILDFTFKIRAQQDFTKIIDIQIYEKEYCAKRFVILNWCIFMHSVTGYLDIRF